MDELVKPRGSFHETGFRQRKKLPVFSHVTRINACKLAQACDAYIPLPDTLKYEKPFCRHWY